MRHLALALALLCLWTASGCTSAASTPKAKHHATYPSMPDIRGMDSVGAYGVLDDAGLPVKNDSFIDLSVLHRETDGVHDWTVWSTSPASGEPVRPGTELHIFVLKKPEWEFFDANKTMPKMPVKPGKEIPAPYPMPFRKVVSELVEWRYAPKYTPKGAKLTTSWPAPTAGLPTAEDLSIEPAAERSLRAKFREADSFDDGLFARLAQRPGSPLRPGQMVTVLVRPKPAEHPELYPNYVPPTHDDLDLDLHVDVDHHDHDFNVPGWLCPTRFC